MFVGKEQLLTKSTERLAVEAAFRENFPLFTGEISDDLSAADVTGWDSFAHVNLMFSIEGIIDRSFDVSETFALANIGELIRYLESVES